MMPSGDPPFEARDRYTLRIGGLSFAARLPEGVTAVEEDVLYRDFLESGSPASPEPVSDVVPVELKLGGAPDVDRLPVVFDTGETWSAHRDGDSQGVGDTVLRLRTPHGPDSHLWTARLPAEPERPIEVCCGGLLISDGGHRLANPLHYPLDQLLSMWALARRGGLVVHAGGVALGGRGIFLAGRSGTGKTTFLRLTAGRASLGGEELAGLSDDRVIVRRGIAGGLELHGTPWAGEGRVAAARRVPFAAAVFLRQSSRNEVRPITPSAALEQLLPVASIPFFDGPRRDAALAFAGELVAAVPAFELRFRPETAAIELLSQLSGDLDSANRL